MRKLYVSERTSFPDPRHTLAEGIVDVSDDLRVERLLEAYSFGIFPWPHEDLPTLWYSPDERGVLDFNEFHIPRSLAKVSRKAPWTCTFNRDFSSVIEACASIRRPHQRGTWISRKLVRAYLDFHRAGYAHSVEVWDGTELVGGLYGVYVAGVFSGESMFFRVPNASKFALVQLVEFLRANGLTWMDIQMVTPLLQTFGGKYISRQSYLDRLTVARAAAKYIEFSSHART
ncbi:MAG: leucyl/phenylalanyl-tRNA--protein transferase [Bdellovibrionales bacterium]